HPQLLGREAGLEARLGEPVLTCHRVPRHLCDHPHRATAEPEERRERELPHLCHLPRSTSIMPPPGSRRALRETLAHGDPPTAPAPPRCLAGYRAASARASAAASDATRATPPRLAVTSRRRPVTG